MHSIESEDIQCPYCGEIIEMMIDCSVFPQEYIEDCSVCCHPITVHVEQNSDNQLVVSVKHENA